MKEMTGKGFFDSIKKITSNPIAKSIVKSVAPIAANMAAQQVKNFTGSDAASNITKSLINESSKELTSGQGIKYIRGGSFAALGSGAKIKSKSGGNVQLKSAVENQKFLGIGHNNPDFSNPHQERMRHVRSFRKSNGIVM